MHGVKKGCKYKSGALIKKEQRGVNRVAKLKYMQRE